MVKSLLAILRLFVTVPFFEALGAAATVAFVAVHVEGWWWLVAVAVLSFLKSLDLAKEGR